MSIKSLLHAEIKTNGKSIFNENSNHHFKAILTTGNVLRMMPSDAAECSQGHVIRHRTGYSLITTEPRRFEGDTVRCETQPLNLFARAYRTVPATTDAFGRSTDNAPALLVEGIPALVETTGETFAVPSRYGLKPGDVLRVAGTSFLIVSVYTQDGLSLLTVTDSAFIPPNS